MNWLLIIILAVIVGNVLWGYKKGFMSVVISLVSWVVVLIACNVLTPVVAEGILDNTPLAEVVQEAVNGQLNAAVDGVVSDALDNETIAEIEAQIPEQILAVILGEHESFADLIASGKEEIQVDTTGVASAAAQLIALMIVLIITRVALVVVEKVLNLVAKLPLIGQANALLGVIAGALKGLVWCWVVLAVIAMLTYTGANTELIAMVNESAILTWLYENNLIMSALSGVL